MSVLWPRLHLTAARVQLARIDRSNPALSVSTSHAAQVFASTGGSRATSSLVQLVRDAILDVALAHDYPRISRDPVAFDRALAPTLFDTMPMSIGEAATRPVWNFIALVVAPDVTAWRFGFDNEERWICSDRNRHMFSRLWWHEYLLGGRDDGERLLDGLTERDLNQLLERTSIGGCAPLLRSLAKEILQLHASMRSRDVVGDACLRMLRYMSFLDFHAMDRANVDELVQKVMSECVRIHVPHAATGRELPPPKVAPP